MGQPLDNTVYTYACAHTLLHMTACYYMSERIEWLLLCGRDVQQTSVAFMIALAVGERYSLGTVDIIVVVMTSSGSLAMFDRLLRQSLHRSMSVGRGGLAGGLVAVSATSGRTAAV